MSANTKKIGIGVLAVLLTAVCVIGGVLLSGRISNNAASSNPSAKETVTEREALPVGEKVAVPGALHAAKLTLSEITSAQYGDTMRTIAQLGFNGVVFRNGQGESEAFRISDASDTLSSAAAAAREAGLYTAALVEYDEPKALSAWAKDCGTDALVFSDLFTSQKSKQADELLQTVASIEEAVQPSAVGTVFWLLPFDANKSIDNAGFLTAFAKAIQSASCTGLCMSADTADDAFSDTAEHWMDYAADKPIWFSLSDRFDRAQTGFMRAEAPLRQVSSLLKLQTTDTPVSYIFGEWVAFAQDETCAQIVERCIREGILPDSYLKSFKITNHTTRSFSTSESKVSFTGESNPSFPLTCNGTAVPVTEDGFFSVEYPVKAGKNTFNFSVNGQSYPYTVQYNLDLIRSILPSGNLKTIGGNALEISVVAHRNASVYATLGGTKIQMTSSGALLSDGDNGHMDTSSDYVTFTGKYTLPQGRSGSVFLGTIQAHASYAGTSDSMNGARVTVTAEQKVEALPVVNTPKPVEITLAPTTTSTAAPTETTAKATTAAGSESESADESVSDSDSSEKESSEKAAESSASTSSTTASTTSTTSSTSATTAKQTLSPVITPYQNHGLAGTKRMCKIKTYYTETMPLSPLNDLSVPLSTPLLAGTFDFITGESSFDKYTYYNLGSGRRVYRKDVEVIEKAYAMPANELTVVGSGTSGSKTSMNLHLTWKVPFNVVLNGQRYINDPHNRREYAVSSLNARSLDITFYYTANASGQPNVSQSGVISSAEWVKSASAQTCTLRLYLRNVARFYGYSVSYNSDDTLNISIKEKGSDSISGKTIMIDPGHGGADGGAPCSVNGSTYTEAKLALAISEKVKAKLNAMGASVIMTRTANTDLTMVNRKRMARQNNPDAFVSIHLDSATSSSGYGTTAFYYRPYSQALAKSIHTQLVNTYVQNIYGTNKSSIDRGTIFYPYSVTRIEECPAVLIECGFVSNLEECRILQNSKHQDSIASAIANGIRNFFASN